MVEDLELGSQYNPTVSKSLFFFILITSLGVQPNSPTKPARICYSSLSFPAGCAWLSRAGYIPILRGIIALLENSFLHEVAHRCYFLSSGPTGMKGDSSSGLPIFSEHQKLKCKYQLDLATVSSP